MNDHNFTPQKSLNQQHKDTPKQAVKQLKELFVADLKKRCPSLPDIAVCAPSFNDKSANGLTKCIIAWITLTGGQAERINTTGRPIDRRTEVKDCIGRTRVIGSVEWVKGTATAGSADISAIIKDSSGRGLSVKIEVKIGKDRQSDAQKKYEQSVINAGGVYYIARDFATFHEWYSLFVREVKS